MSNSEENVTYTLYAWTGQRRRNIPFAREQFDAVQVARERLVFGLVFEQRIDIALENFAELEKCILDMALRNALFRGESDERLRQGRHVVNRYLANFMSSGKLYVDQTSHALSGFFGEKSIERSDFLISTNTEYDNCFGYRVFEALRNYSQHRGLPTHSLAFSAKREEEEGSATRICNVVSFGLKPKSLREDGKFKRAILDELDAKVDKNGVVALMPLARDYISGLARIHETCRERIKGWISEADQTVFDTVNMAKDENGEPAWLLQAAKNLPDRSQVTEYVNLKPVEERKRYEQKNRSAAHISSQYVVS
ncbi:MAG: hypothetical protein CMN89_14680 [Sutterellaceae bacterium]|uniref:hypothetical protein n=1 Tax=Limnobacter sp. UBA7229 TaxID=1946762 RepID=UPI000C6586E5|nr:hypothetical protein [Limnobacter sp. UBA7229]MAG81333.1 hypothetical protein [Sutterellaceae bacterium]MAG81433.1 hypothetical protein [Sutterellaceae bacterium]MBT85702.1 hypothetical protein [Sutterellaceae bacterium]|tara:strand:- start:443 stop:1372 length:930 start_codon:yes stop_codon:yes gene_type:complete